MSKKNHTPALGFRRPVVDVLLGQSPVVIRVNFPESGIPVRECRTFGELSTALLDIKSRADFSGTLELDYLAPPAEGRPPTVERTFFIRLMSEDVHVTDIKVSVTSSKNVTIKHVRFTKKRGLMPHFVPEELNRFRN